MSELQVESKKESEAKRKNIFSSLYARFPKGRKRSKMERKENWIAFLYILPPIIGFCIFTIGAMIFSFMYSFEKYNILTQVSKPVGFENYKTLFTHITIGPAFKRSIVNTVVLLLSIPICNILGMGLAGLLRMGNVKGSKFYQVLYYLPAVSSAVAMNIVWRFIFNDERGFINLLFGLKTHWLSDDTLIKVAIIIKNSLNGMGGAMILYLAGMLNVPKDYYEASELDGAGKLRQFFSITLPLLTPVAFYQLITGLIGGLQSYADADVFGAGVAGSQTIVWFIWNQGFTASKNYGVASAASIFLSLCIMIITVVQFKLSNKWVYEE